MVRIDENTKSVRFPEAVDERLTLLARKLGRTKREVVMQMVDYFYKSKKDPADLNDEVLKKEIFFGTLPCGQEMIPVVRVIVLKPGFVNSVDFEQEMVVTIPPLQTKYVANIKRMWGKIKTFSAFEVI
jgi:predicted DNA-binding protein